jgi:hypothetical protein
MADQLETANPDASEPSLTSLPLRLKAHSAADADLKQPSVSFTQPSQSPDDVREEEGGEEDPEDQDHGVISHELPQIEEKKKRKKKRRPAGQRGMVSSFHG